MDNNNLVNIDDLVRQRLTGGEEHERSGAWLRMRELLDKEEERKPVGFIWRRMFGALAIMTLIAFVSLGGYKLSSYVTLGGNDAHKSIASAATGTVGSTHGATSATSGEASSPDQPAVNNTGNNVHRSATTAATGDNQNENNDITTTTANNIAATPDHTPATADQNAPTGANTIALATKHQSVTTDGMSHTNATGATGKKAMAVNSVPAAATSGNATGTDKSATATNHTAAGHPVLAASAAGTHAPRTSKLSAMSGSGAASSAQGNLNPSVTGTTTGGNSNPVENGSNTGAGSSKNATGTGSGMAATNIGTSNTTGNPAKQSHHKTSAGSTASTTPASGTGTHTASPTPVKHHSKTGTAIAKNTAPPASIIPAANMGSPVASTAPPATHNIKAGTSITKHTAAKVSGTPTAGINSTASVTPVKHNSKTGAAIAKNTTPSTGAGIHGKSTGANRQKDADMKSLAIGGAATMPANPAGVTADEMDMPSAPGKHAATGKHTASSGTHGTSSKLARGKKGSTGSLAASVTGAPKANQAASSASSTTGVNTVAGAAPSKHTQLAGSIAGIKHTTATGNSGTPKKKGTGAGKSGTTGGSTTTSSAQSTGALPPGTTLCGHTLMSKTIEKLTVRESMMQTSPGVFQYHLDTISREEILEEFDLSKSALASNSGNDNDASANPGSTPAAADASKQEEKASESKAEVEAAKKKVARRKLASLEETFNDIKYKINGARFAMGVAGGVNGTFFGPSSFKGFQFGVTGNFIFSESVNIMTELKYFHRINSDYVLNDNYYNYTPNANGTYNKQLEYNPYSFSALHSFELPFIVRYTKSKFNFFGGINVSYAFAINEGGGLATPDPNNTTIATSIGNDNAPKIHAGDFAARFGLGYLFGVAVQLSPEASLDLRDVQSFWDNANTAGSKEVSRQLYKAPSFQLTLGYRFGGKRNKEK